MVGALVAVTCGQTFSIASGVNRTGACEGEDGAGEGEGEGDGCGFDADGAACDEDPDAAGCGALPHPAKSRAAPVIHPATTRARITPLMTKTPLLIAAYSLARGGRAGKRGQAFASRAHIWQGRSAHGMFRRIIRGGDS
jgi:hypothetical protein